MARPQKFRLSPDDVLDPQNARKLAGHVSEVEFFRAEVEKLQAQIAGVYDAADEEGFDKKYIRKVVAIRAKDEAVAKAEQEGVDAYTQALEIGFRSRARVENVPHDADGVVLEDDEITDPRHGAGGAEDEAQVAADIGAPSSAQPIQAETPNSSTAARKDVPGPVRMSPASDPQPEPQDRIGGLGNDPQVVILAAGTQAPPVETNPEPETLPPAVVSDAGDRNSAVTSDAAIPVVPRTHNPETHFLNSEGLARLHGCLKPDSCAGTWRALCSRCSPHEAPAA